MFLVKIKLKIIKQGLIKEKLLKIRKEIFNDKNKLIDDINDNEMIKSNKNLETIIQNDKKNDDIDKENSNKKSNSEYNDDNNDESSYKKSNSEYNDDNNDKSSYKKNKKNK